MHPIWESFRNGQRCILKCILLVMGPGVTKIGWELWGVLSWLFVTLECVMTSLSLEGKVIALMYGNKYTKFWFFHYSTSSFIVFNG